MFASSATAQRGSPPDTRAVSVDIAGTFPDIRAMGDVPPVTGTGAVMRQDGSVIVLAATPAYALADLTDYGLQLQSVLPISTTDYPADSIARAQKARASAWLAKLYVSPTDRSLRGMTGRGITGWQLVPLAKIAFEAGEDTLAYALFDRRLAETAHAAPEMSYVVWEAVNTLVTPQQDSSRLLSNLTRAERYASRMPSLSDPNRFGTGRVSARDGAVVLYRRLSVDDTLAAVYALHGNVACAMTHATNVLRLAVRVDANERRRIVANLYRKLAMAVAQRPERREQIAKINAWLLATGRQISPALEREWREVIDEFSAPIGWIGAIAPPIAAHAWLNTPDSSYQATARVHDLAGGSTRILLFSDIQDNTGLAVLTHVAHWFPDRVQCLLVTHTVGRTGPDLATPEQEIDEIRDYLIRRRHVAVPVAVWAGPTARYNTDWSGAMIRPAPSPADTSSYRNRLGAFVVVDRRGAVRWSQDVDSRADEALFRSRLEDFLTQH